MAGKATAEAKLVGPGLQLNMGERRIRWLRVSHLSNWEKDHAISRNMKPGGQPDLSSVLKCGVGGIRRVASRHWKSGSELTSEVRTSNPHLAVIPNAVSFEAVGADVITKGRESWKIRPKSEHLGAPILRGTEGIKTSKKKKKQHIV